MLVALQLAHYPLMTKFEKDWCIGLLRHSHGNYGCRRWMALQICQLLACSTLSPNRLLISNEGFWKKDGMNLIQVLRHLLCSIKEVTRLFDSDLAECGNATREREIIHCCVKIIVFGWKKIESGNLYARYKSLKK